MFVTIINDCRDENAAGRQLTRAAALFNAPATLVGVGAFGDLEAAGQLIDTLDAGEGREGVVLVNVAPRHGTGKRFPNGSPFCSFRYKETLILSTIDGYTLSLAKKLEILDAPQVFDIAGASAVLAAQGLVTQEEAARIPQSQFRSFNFLPRAARAILDGSDLPAAPLTTGEIPDPPEAVWFVDNFGNCKTTLLPEELGANPMVTVNDTGLHFLPSLKDVPNDQTAIVVGSSGLENRRFLEIVAQGSSAAQQFGLSVGSEIVT